jgi:hypothetical protein
MGRVIPPRVRERCACGLELAYMPLGTVCLVCGPTAWTRWRVRVRLLLFCLATAIAIEVARLVVLR